MFFVAENAILSENRTFLIEQLGDQGYHAMYGLFSTTATASIGYSYFYLSRRVSSESAAVAVTAARRGGARTMVVAGTSWLLLSTGWNLALQAAPRVQVPIDFEGQEEEEAKKQDSETIASNDSGTVIMSTKVADDEATAESAKGTLFQIRCPFDFATDRNNKERQESLSSEESDDGIIPYGTERISRHPGLWALAFLGLGQSLMPALSPSLRLWYVGPTLVAWLGGMHSDSRFQRGMGGMFDPVYESQTSNVPFVAMLAGRQPQLGDNDINDNPVGASLKKLFSEEWKPLNSVIATSIATVMVMIRLRSGGRFP